MKWRDDRTPTIEHRGGFDPDAFVQRLVHRVRESDGSYPYLDTATHLLSIAAGWAYADEVAFRDVIARCGLADASCRSITVANDAMFVDATAYLVRSRCRRLAVLAFRGTLPRNVIDWFTDASVSPVAFRELGMVHGGFYRNVVALWPAICEKLDEFQADGRLQALYITGHSLGGAMAALAGMLLRYDQDHAGARDKLRGIYTFGQPMIAEPALAARCARDLGAITFRHVYGHDIVPRLPPLSTGPFAHFGHEYGSADGRWQARDAVVSQTLSAVVSIPIGALAWVLRQVALTRWLDLPFSWDDHSPIHYVRCSQMPPEVDITRVKRVGAPQLDPDVRPDRITHDGNGDSPLPTH